MVGGSGDYTLLLDKYGQWMNIDLRSENVTEAIEGLKLNSHPNQNNIFVAQGTTNIYLKTKPIDNQTAGNPYGLRIFQGAKDNNTINATFNVLDILVSSEDPNGVRAKGIELGGTHQLTGVHDETVGLMATLNLQGNTSVKAYTKSGYAIGIQVGDELGDQNVHGGGILNMSGKKNLISIEQETNNSDGRNARTSAGILVSNQGTFNIAADTDTAVITKTHHAGNAAVAQGGIIVDRNSTFLSKGTLTIDSEATNSTTGNILHGVSADLYASVLHKSETASKIELGRTNIILHTNNQTDGYALASYGGSHITSHDLLKVELEADQAPARFAAVYAGSTYLKNLNQNWLDGMKGGAVDVLGGLTVNLSDAIKPGTDGIYALKADGESAKKLERNPVITVGGGADKLIQLNGNVAADRDGEINLTMSNADSYLTGWAHNNTGEGKVGTINLELANGSVWNVISKLDSAGSVLPGDSKVDSLKLDNSVLNMSYAAENNKTDWEGTDHRQYLTITGTGDNQGLTVNDSTIKMDIDLANETVGNKLLDQIEVQGKAEGTFSGVINFVGGLDQVAADKMHSENWLITQKSGVMTATGTSAANGAMQSWALKFFNTDDQTKLPTTQEELDAASSTSDGNEGWWYLVRSSSKTPEENTNTNVGTSTGQALSWAAEIEDLRLRLGEVRYGAQDGVWAKTSFTKDKAEGVSGHGFTQHTNAIHVGLDRLTATTEESSWILGAALRYGHSEQEGFAAANGGSGDLDQYSAKLYATWMHQSGIYADLVLQGGYYEQDLDGIANDGKTSFNASYHTWGYGASVEIGHMFTLAQDKEADDRLWYSQWFLEPQAQLSYFAVKGADYTTSTGMQVSQDNADFLTGRLGFVLGKKVNYGGLDDLDKRYFQAALMGGVKYEFLGDQGIDFTGADGVRRHVDASDMSGARFYYGVMADWQATDNLRFYGQVSREEGDSYTREYAVHFGVKYQF